MHFRTEIVLPKSPFMLHQRHKLLLVGSCFTEHIGKKLQNCQFPALLNPFGIVFHPLPLAASLRQIWAGKRWTQVDLTQNGELWVSLLHHSAFSGRDGGLVLQNIQQATDKAHDFLQTADCLLLTFGTAWGYAWNETGEIVANCHKIPGRHFSKRLSETTEIVAAWADLLQLLWATNPKLKVVFTVSPVRHWKDGAVENQWSKAVLLLAIRELCQRFPDNCLYFPAYELVIDELRDYRFFEADMLHPNQVAIDYVWQRFGETFFEAETRQLNQQLLRLQSAQQHRPLQADTQAYQDFLTALERQKQALKQQYDFISWE